MLTALPGVFCAGEMLDWEAPTGGYLLTACLASGLVAGEGALGLSRGARLNPNYAATSRQSEVTSFDRAAYSGSDRIGGARMMRFHIEPPVDLQPGRVDPLLQLRARAQAEMFREIRQNQPAFAAGLRCAARPSRKPRSIRLSGS